MVDLYQHFSDIEGIRRMEHGAFDRRRAPYAPISALREFFEKIRGISVPTRVDRKFLQKLNVASNNEWALLSALKFLGVVDEHGSPTHSYRRLQTTDQFTDALGHLVRTAYSDLWESGGMTMSSEDLENYFRVTSSASQAKNAARFFREVSRLAALEADAPDGHQVSEAVTASPVAQHVGPAEVPVRRPDRDVLLQAKTSLLEKLPAPRPEWSAEEYKDICDRFLAMLESLERI